MKFSLQSALAPRILSGLTHGLRVLRGAALDFVYPPRCLLCESDSIPGTDLTGHHTSFCVDCQNKLYATSGRACRRCGAPLGPFSPASARCVVCSREHYAFDEVVRLGLYQDELRTACLIAKGHNGALMCQALAELFIEAQSHVLQDLKPDVVMPVPEHWIKRITRPQYAAETLSREFARRLKVRLATSILVKQSWTQKQARSTPAERRMQQHNSFGMAWRANLQRQTVLLVDDILTTGATAHEAARVLKQAGAKRVIVAVIAVSPPSV
jgi:ComF family protein